MPVDLSRIKVLVVEDHAMMRELIRGLLGSLNITNVVTAGSVEDGWRALVAASADVLVCDWQLPDGEGIDLVRRVRHDRDSRNPYMPIMMLTAFNEEHRVMKAMQEGVTTYLLKPVTADRFVRRFTYCVTDRRDFMKSDQYFGPIRADDQSPTDEKTETSVPGTQS